MGAIEKRKGVRGASYQVRVRLKKKSFTKTFSRLQDARAWERMMEAKIESGESLPGNPARRIMVAEMLERYSRDVIPGRAEISQPWLRNQLRVISDSLGHLSLADLAPEHVVDFRQRLAEGLTGTKLSDASQNRYLALLSNACAVAAREWGWMESNPVQKVRRRREPPGRDRFLDEQEKGRLLKTCLERNYHLYLFVLLAISTGGRKAEILALRWKDVDLDVGREVGRAVFRDTKNGEHRGVPLTGAALEEMRALSNNPRVSEFVLWWSPKKDPATATRARFPRRDWNNALKESGIEDFRPHDLRHTAASYLLMSGATLGELAGYLGHKSLAMVQRYAHLAPGHLDSVSAKMTSRYLAKKEKPGALEGLISTEIPASLFARVADRVGGEGSPREIVKQALEEWLAGAC